MSLLAPSSVVASLPLGMHAPDGLFSMPVNALFAAVVVVLLGGAARVISRRRDHRLVPLMGVMAAFVFAGQMVNFPVGPGTTGHLLGGTLAAIMLGPWAGTIVLATVVFFQALLGDGGLTTLGPNIFNMGIVGTCLGYFVYRAAVGQSLGNSARVIAGSFFAAWVAVVLASTFASIQLAASGTATLSRTLPAMVATHMLIGIGEALITAFVVAFVLKTRPELLHGRSEAASTRKLGRPVIACGLAVSLAIAAGLSLAPTLWEHPDGLESIGFEQGFILDETRVADDGTLATLPAYPLGVRLEVVDGSVTAVHRYDGQAGAVAVGDVIERIGTTRITDLAAVDEALGLDAVRGEPMSVVVRRDGQRRELAVRASVAPRAGSTAPMIALLPDYNVPGMTGLVSTSLAGALGTIVMFIVSLAIGRTLTRPSRLAQAVQAAADEPA